MNEELHLSSDKNETEGKKDKEEYKCNVFRLKVQKKELERN